MISLGFLHDGVDPVWKVPHNLFGIIFQLVNSSTVRGHNNKHQLKTLYSSH